jgi:GNAT superfamily N-acetyltransferase
MNILYTREKSLTVDEFATLLGRTSLGARRPLHDRECLGAMLRHASLLCTAWDGDRLVGVARSVTDFAYCCYLSDLAVDESYQRQGIGRKLIELTRSALGKHARLILVAAPQATEYYPHLGFHPHPSAWFLDAADQNPKP